MCSSCWWTLLSLHEKAFWLILFWLLTAGSAFETSYQSLVGICKPVLFLDLNLNTGFHTFIPLSLVFIVADVDGTSRHTWNLNSVQSHFSTGTVCLWLCGTIRKRTSTSFPEAIFHSSSWKTSNCWEVQVFLHLQWRCKDLQAWRSVTHVSFHDEHILTTGNKLWVILEGMIKQGLLRYLLVSVSASSGTGWELLRLSSALLKLGHSRCWDLSCSPCTPFSSSADLLFGPSSVPHRLTSHFFIYFCFSLQSFQLVRDLFTAPYCQ